MTTKVLKVHPADNVLVALKDINEGETVRWNNSAILLREMVPGKHKIFTENLNRGDKVTMYGVTVGTIQEAVSEGSCMTVNNTKHAADPFA